MMGDAAGVDEREIDDADLEALQMQDDDGEAESSDDESTSGAGHDDLDWLKTANILRGDPVQVDVFHGAFLFYTNKFTECDDFFAAPRDDPIYSVGRAVLSVIRAVFTFEQVDIDQAHTFLDLALAHSKKKAAFEGAFSTLARYARWRAPPPPTREQFAARINFAEMKLMGALLYVLDERISSLVRAGLGVTAALSHYHNLLKTLKQHPDLEITSSDAGGIIFGLGVFNLMLSVLPRPLLRVARTLGFKADREQGLKWLEVSRTMGEGTGLRGPSAAFLLLTYHVLLQAFLCLPDEMHIHISKSESILENIFAQFKDSAVFLFIKGRLLRLQNRLPESTETFKKCVAVQQDWRQLQHLCAYEIGWNTFTQGDFPASVEQWKILQAESKWSKSFYSWMLGLCRLSRKELPLAVEAFNQAGAANTRRLIGKTLSVEQYVHRKVKVYKLDTTEGVASLYARMLPLEILYLWNLVPASSKPLLTSRLAEVESIAAEASSRLERQEGNDEKLNELRRTCALVRGICLRETGRFVEALALFREAGAGGVPSGEKWLWAHASYEEGLLLLMSAAQLPEGHAWTGLGAALEGSEEGDAFQRATRAKKLLKEISKSRADYDFEIRLRLRLQSALAHSKKVIKRVKPGEKPGESRTPSQASTSVTSDRTVSGAVSATSDRPASGTSK
mmetsp:Transcript_25002/g.59669  ORF Transcript_25002/g.59669 Transcript_25002/m.59669 type:complete len:677 (+) Transcript_25002:36-2066(+)